MSRVSAERVVDAPRTASQKKIFLEGCTVVEKSN